MATEIVFLKVSRSTRNVTEIENDMNSGFLIESDKEDHLRISSEISGLSLRRGESLKVTGGG